MAKVQSDPDIGVLVVGHGTRDPAGQAQMRNLACQTAGQLAPVITELAFLELASPDIEQGVGRLAAAGVRRMVTLPVLLFRAGHALRDIPDAVAVAAKKYGIEVLAQTAPLEIQPSVVELSTERYRDALCQAMGDAELAKIPPENIALAMIARGSSSESAADAMTRFAALRVESTPVGRHTVGYVAVRQPDVAATLDALGRTDAQILVVQPHLLFEGEVYHSLCQAVEERRLRDLASAEEAPTHRRRWVVCRPLGAAADDFDDERLAKVLAELFHGECD